MTNFFSKSVYISTMLLSHLAFADSAIYSYQNHSPLHSDKNTLIYIHGSPGNHRAFKKYIKDENLNEKFNIIAIDRPGYGKSKKYKKQLSMPKQASLIKNHLLSKIKINDLNTKKYFVSHSYGAPLSTIIAKQIDSIDGLILMAGPYNPKYNMVRWYNKMGQWYIIRTLIGKFWITSNQEMLRLNKDLIHVQNALKNYNGETHFLHGNKDGIVAIKHSEWAHKLRQENQKTTQFLEYTSNHFFVWTKFKMIKEYLLSLDD